MTLTSLLLEVIEVEKRNLNTHCNKFYHHRTPSPFKLTSKKCEITVSIFITGMFSQRPSKVHILSCSGIVVVEYLESNKIALLTQLRIFYISQHGLLYTFLVY